MIKKHIMLNISLTALLIFIFTCQAAFTQSEHKGDILYYTCAMHPSVKVDPKQYADGQTKCPICHMPLTPVKQEISMETETFDEDVISRVNIKVNELKLAGVQTQPVGKRQLYKEVRTVGTVAYDPELAIAQDEFMAALRTYNKTKEGKNAGIKNRAESLVESSKKKLKLMGLSDEQIIHLEHSKDIQTNLILPEKKMWIYGNIYEHEIEWVDVGAKVKVTAISLPGEEFTGEIASINPVIDSNLRSLRFRAQVDNSKLKLKPDMYVDVVIMSHYKTADGKQETLSIPKEALLDTGRRKIVWVDKGNGAFEGRKVDIGPIATVWDNEGAKDFYPVLKGLKEGERVVTKGNFLIDSQSQITGVVATSYGGALEPVEQKGSPSGHVH